VVGQGRDAKRGGACRSKLEPAAEPEPRADTSGRVALGAEVSVTRLGFGAMRITGPGIWGEPADRSGALGLVRRAVELGVNFIDTAAAYGPGVSEGLISEALYPYPEDLIVATKSGFRRGGPNRWHADGRAETIRSDCERSLTLLRRETIDLFQLHAIDPNVPIEDSVATFAELQRQGKVRMIGVSNVNLEELQRARAVAEIVSAQNRYSIGDRASEDVLEVCARDGLAFLPWNPLAAGRLTRERRLETVAAAHDATPAQVAIA
jgi:pyridoxine 4-dehydrogenase